MELLLTEDQLKRMVKNTSKKINEDDHPSSMAKQQLFLIATMAYKMWEILDESEELDNWMESKIAQSEQSLSSVVKSYLYDEFKDNVGGPNIDPDELVIGK